MLGGLAAFLPVVGYGFYALWSIPPSPVQYTQASTAPVVPTPAVAPSSTLQPLPIRLQIPRIKVNANIEVLGITPAGNMDVPPNIQDVGWYKYGPHPGEAGSAVIVGHFGTLKGKKSVFNDLKWLKVGDVLSVADDAGQTTSYAVRKVRTYRDTDSTNDVFNNERAGAHLNLITCAGAWNKAQKAYAKRLVVFTDKIE